MAGSCEHADGPLCSIKCGDFLDQPMKYELIKKDCAAWT